MDGWNESHSSQDGDRANNERQILQDLIAELRELATCDIDLGNQTDPETLAFLLDRAEARLREVGDE
jgi:hypothetical protein